MSLCIAAGGMLLSLAVTEFELSWTHSVTHGLWWERWEVGAEGLRPVEARIEGSGAGMEPPEGAVLRDGAWHYTPDLPPQREIHLAASGMTGAGWRLCAADKCHDLGVVAAAPVRLWQAPRCEG